MRQEPQHRDYRRVILLEAMSSSRSSAPDRVYVSTRPCSSTRPCCLARPLPSCPPRVTPPCVFTPRLFLPASRSSARPNCAYAPCSDPPVFFYPSVLPCASSSVVCSPSPVRQEVPAVFSPRRSVFPLCSSTWRVRLPFRLLVSPFGLLTSASPALVRVLPVHHLSKPHFSLLQINPMRALPPLAAHAPLHARRNRRSRDAAASLHPFGSTRTSHTPHASATHAALPSGFHAPRISPALPSARAVVAPPPPSLRARFPYPPVLCCQPVQFAAR